MLRIFKISIGLLMAASLTAKVSAFSLGGAIETWQTPDLNYGVDVIPRSLLWVGEDFGAPKYLGEEYRLNTPKLTYGFDASFQNYFGAAGIAAVDKAMAIMNDLKPVSAYSTDLTEFATESVQQSNPTATALRLFDMKSMVVSLMLEHMGLMDDSHVFDLQGRSPVPGGGPCDFIYGVVNKNWDPVTWDPSYYVNGVQYHYQIMDLCNDGAAFADAVEQTDDTTDAGLYGTVASWRGLRYGGFYNQITRDDMGGLRYIYRASNRNNESLPPGAIVIPTVPNSGSPWNPLPVYGTNVITSTNSFMTNALFCGVEKITFIKDTNSLPFEDTFKPVTVKYPMSTWSNGVTRTITVSRTTPRPDIVFSAANLANPPYYSVMFTRDLTFVNNSKNGGAGPGSIMPQMTIVFNNAGLILVNEGPVWLESTDAIKQARWASFDGTTKDPIIFPNGTSIRDLENQILGQ